MCVPARLAANERSHASNSPRPAQRCPQQRCGDRDRTQIAARLGTREDCRSRRAVERSEVTTVAHTGPRLSRAHAIPASSPVRGIAPGSPREAGRPSGRSPVGGVRPCPTRTVPGDPVRGLRLLPRQRQALGLQSLRLVVVRVEVARGGPPRRACRSRSAGVDRVRSVRERDLQPAPPLREGPCASQKGTSAVASRAPMSATPHSPAQLRRRAQIAPLVLQAHQPDVLLRAAQ